jgi:hypothetical protein
MEAMRRKQARLSSENGADSAEVLPPDSIGLYIGFRPFQSIYGDSMYRFNAHFSVPDKLL